MATAQLNATLRTDTGKGVARKLRQSGQIPGIIYGHARESQALTINTREFEKLLDHISAENTVIELALGGKTSRTLIREIQRHPIRQREYLHVDFQELVAGETVSVYIPLVLSGLAAGVRLEGGILDQVLREVEIEVDPANMPNRIEVDVTNLNIGESIHLRDIVLPPGVTPITDVDTTIVVCSAPRAAIEEAAAAPAEGAEPAATAEPEVIRAKKTEEETEEK